MARFKFSRKKKDTDADHSGVSNTLAHTGQGEVPHSYLRRPSILSKTQENDNLDGENGTYTVSDDAESETAGGYDSARPKSTVKGEFLSQKLSATTPWKRHKLFDSPFPRYRHAALGISLEKNEIFLMGGLKDGSVFGDTWKIVPKVSGNGKEINALEAHHVEVLNNNNPPARVGHSLVLCGNAYIVYGGDTVDTDHNGSPDDNFYMFNINNKKYTVPLQILNKPLGRYGHLLGVVLQSTQSSRLYLFGGQLENDVYDDMYYFELTTFKLPKARWEVVAPHNNFRPPPLTNHLMAVYKNKIYVFGGVYNNEKVLNDVWCFETHSNKWLQIHPLGDVPPPVNEHSACIVGDNMFVYGGNDFCGTIYNTLYCLNLHSFRWTLLNEVAAAGGPGARCGHSMTYIPKLNKVMIMGGDKNDYIYPQANNFSTYEEYNGQDVGTMVYELDVERALYLMSGGTGTKIAASAGGGAAGVLNRRAASPVPSEDAMTRHRRSLSAGIDEYLTPNGSVDKFNKLLDPLRSKSEQATDDPVAEKFVDVDVASSAGASISATQELNEIRENYLQSHDLQQSEFPHLVVVDENDQDESGISKDRVRGSQTPDLTENYEVETGSGFDVEGANVDGPVVVANVDQSSPIMERGANGAQVANGSGQTGQASPEKTPYDNSALASPSTSNWGPEDPVKKAVLEITRELNELKASAKAQMETATARIEALEQQNTELQWEKETELSRHLEAHKQALQEKDALIHELRLAVDPSVLEINDNPAAGKEISSRGFNELTKYKLDRLDMMNKLVYFENENSQLKQKHAQFEPFMNNQITELATLHKVVEAQELRIGELQRQVKLELALHKQINDWKHKYDDLELEFNTYRSLNAEVYVSSDKTGGSVQPISQLSSQLGNLVSLWQSGPAHSEKLRDVADVDSKDDLVKLLQSQVDELLKTSHAQRDFSSAEVNALEAELQAKTTSLKSYEENYKDALQSVKNISKALALTQGELQTQKLLIDKLHKENNELKLFKKAANALKKHLFQVSDSSCSNGSLPVAVSRVANADDDTEDDDQFTAAHYNMRLKDLEADLYILKQERDQLNAQVTALKKELYLAKS